jgi:dihydroneopterin aldolase
MAARGWATLASGPGPTWIGVADGAPEAVARRARGLPAPGADLVEVPGEPPAALARAAEALGSEGGMPWAARVATAEGAEAALARGAWAVTGRGRPWSAAVWRVLRGAGVPVLAPAGPGAADAGAVWREAAGALDPDRVAVDVDAAGLGPGESAERLAGALRLVGAGWLAVSLGEATGPAAGAAGALAALAAAAGVRVLRARDLVGLRGAAAAGAAWTAAGGTPEAPGTGASIAVRGLRLWASHGVLPEEAERLQPFVVDLELDVDLRGAAATDDLGATVDYARAMAIVRDVVVAGPRRRLIEALAGAIADAVLAAFPQVRGGTVVVHKPEAPVGLPFEDVAVRLPFRRAG